MKRESERMTDDSAAPETHGTGSLKEDARLPAPTTWPALSEEGMLDEIIAIIVEEGKVAPEAVVPEATLESLGLVSIDVLSILMGVEEKFNVYLPMSEDLSSARNLAELIEVIAAQMRPDELQNIGVNT